MDDRVGDLPAAGKVQVPLSDKPRGEGIRGARSRSRSSGWPPCGGRCSWEGRGCPSHREGAGRGLRP